MKAEDDYLNINRKAWNTKTKTHLHSEFYDVPSFLKGKSSLKEIELDLLSTIKGKSILHLQCHFGQDSICLSRLGAKVTGVDFSDNAIEAANDLALQTKQNVKFICCDLYELPKHLDQKFDVVFSTYGTIGWLPDISKWAAVVSHFLKPGGKFVFAEFHPVVWMFDNDFTRIEYPYKNAKAIVEVEEGTYSDRKAPIRTQTVGWNHGLAEVISALLNQGLQLKQFSEYDYSPFNCFRNMEEFEPGKFRIHHLENKIPMVYSLLCEKPLL